MSEQANMSGKDIANEAIDNFEAAAELRLTGEMTKETFNEVADVTGRTIGEIAFGACDFPHYCKFYGERPSFCD